MAEIKLKLLREEFTSHSVIGRLLIDNVFQCYTLEDAYREIKAPGQTCIPYGRSELAMIWSDHFLQMMPYLLYVPNFTGVMIHTGNVPMDTRACILVGRQKGLDRISESKLAFALIQPKIEQLCRSQHTYIEILRG